LLLKKKNDISLGIGSTFATKEKEKMKFKNIFKNKGNMTTENTKIDKEMRQNIR
jgi:hypothetical protein